MKNANHSPQISPLHKSKTIFHSQSSSEPKQQPSSSPVKYLLQNNIKINEGNQGERGQQQTAIISSLLKQCIIFDKLGVSREDAGLLKELCRGVVLIYCESPHIMDLKDNELYVFLQGQGFEYMQNCFEGELSQKYRLYEDSQYVMVNKITTNECFLSMPQNNVRYHATRRKYQLMVDQNTLLGKISEQPFKKYFLPRILQKQNKTVAFLKKVDIFSGLPNSFFSQFSKFMDEERVPANSRVLQKGEKSKYVYFVQSGQIEVRTFCQVKGKVANNYYVLPSSPYTSELLSEFDTFGMEQFSMAGNTEEKEVICVKDCQLYKIQKRLLAIIITSFQLEFKQKNKLWSEININNQIKGQNYCTPEQELLLKNAQRIRTSQRKTRDLKLRFYANKKTNKIEESQRKSGEKSGKEAIEDTPHETLINSWTPAVDQRRRMIKTTDGRFRTTSLSRLINTHGGVVDDPKYKAAKKFNSQRLRQTNEVWVNNYQLTTLNEDKNTPSSALLRQSNPLEYKERLQNTKMNRTLCASKHTQSNKLVPHLQTRTQSMFQGNGRYRSDLIGFYLDKKIKNEIVKKAEKVMSMNNNIRLTENKNLKRLFTSRDNRGVNAISQHDKRTIASDIVQRMSNMRDNPLLLQIQSQRRKQERHIKLTQKQAKPISDSPRKYKKEDEYILIRNTAP